MLILKNQSRRGAIVPMAALLLPVILLLAAMAINIAYIQQCQTELDIATDSAARAASRIFSATGSQADAKAAAEQAGVLNTVGGEPLAFRAADIVFGQSDRQDVASRYNFQPNKAPHNAVQVFGLRTDQSAGGSLPTFLPAVVAKNNFSITSNAVSTRIEIDLAIVIDRSGSMAYSDTEPAAYPPIPAAAPAGWYFGDAAPADSRWLDVVDGVSAMLTQLQSGAQNEMVSLATYADGSSLDVRLTQNYPTVLNALSQHTNKLDGGGTNIAAGIAEGADSLLPSNGSRPFAAKVVLLMTDGQLTVGGDPVQIARSAAKRGVMVFTVTFSDEADQALMKQVAEEGGGKHFHAEKREDLIDVFEKIGALLPTLIVK